MQRCTFSVILPLDHDNTVNCELSYISASLLWTATLLSDITVDCELSITVNCGLTMQSLGLRGARGVARCCQEEVLPVWYEVLPGVSRKRDGTALCNEGIVDLHGLLPNCLYKRE